MLSNRKRLILKAIVENYSKEEKPVGSKLLSQVPYLKFSSATIRYDMYQLEKRGYLEKTHTSSGRIPSLKGYVFYLNNLITRKQEIIEIFFLFEKIVHRKNLDKERIIQEILKLVSQLTNHVIINIKPDILKASQVKKIDLIFVNSQQAVILILTNKGNLQYQNIFFDKEQKLIEKDLREIIEVFNYLLVGKYLDQVLEIIQSRVFKEKIIKNIEYKEELIQFFLDSFYNLLVNNASVYGVSNFLEFYKDKITASVKDVYDILDKGKLINFFFDSKKATLKLANQISLIPYKKFIFLSIPYNINENEKGFIAVLGFDIVKYQEIIPILEYLSAHISHLYEKNKI
ncbi:heat-inducible transcriptional repressor HrcA ['Camptotheca acuminata' phytoplasma]|uniref:heat-inducible transcriptional repressor HrcA n=1 Tax='Camptotheca acuminata' phytoplasma TaxID=3239192 RepID=UPI003519F8C9